MVITGDSKSVDYSPHGAPQNGAYKDDFSCKNRLEIMQAIVKIWVPRLRVDVGVLLVG